MIKLYWIEVIQGYRFAAYVAFFCFAVSIYKVCTVSWFLIHANSVESENVFASDMRYGGLIISRFIATYPNVQFVASDGKSYVATGKTNVSSSEIMELKFNKVKVFYNPNNPQDAKLGLFKDLWYFETCLFVFGLLVMSIDYWIFLFDAPLLIHKQDNVVDFNKR